MQNNMGLAAGIIAVVALLGGGYLLWNSQGSRSTDVTVDAGSNAGGTSLEGTNAGNDTDLSGADSGVTSAPASARVSYNGSSFEPKSVTVKKGGTVTWTNDSSGNMWVASAPHPAHTVYAGTTRQEHCPDSAGVAFDQCAGSANDYTFTFDKTGSWNYHDHINASVFGTVVVVE